MHDTLRSRKPHRNPGSVLRRARRPRPQAPAWTGDRRQRSADGRPGRPETLPARTPIPGSAEGRERRKVSDPRLDDGTPGPRRPAHLPKAVQRPSTDGDVPQAVKNPRHDHTCETVAPSALRPVPNGTRCGTRTGRPDHPDGRRPRTLNGGTAALWSDPDALMEVQRRFGRTAPDAKWQPDALCRHHSRKDTTAHDPDVGSANPNRATTTRERSRGALPPDDPTHRRRDADRAQ